MRRKNPIYPIFLPQAGCPFQCVYCNQSTVTTTRQRSSSSADLLGSFEEQLSRLLDQVQKSGRAGEIAFYGGTFTALSRDLLRTILDTASRCVSEGSMAGIRFSTRPDRITPEVCAFLADYPITTVELGVQSFSGEVLARSLRGYTPATVREAVGLVKAQGWRLGLQLMAGLPGDTRERFLESLVTAISLQPDFVRLYPTLVLRETPLAASYRRNAFRPLTLDEALSWCAEAYDLLLKSTIEIARMGLHADPELEKPGSVVAGPYHPAFGYLVRVHWWRHQVDRRMEGRLSCGAGNGSLILHVPDRCVSEVLGPHRSNLHYWREKWGLREVVLRREPAWPRTHFDWLLQ